METINNFLDRVFLDFIGYINSGVELCKLHDSSFANGNLPDYSDSNIEQLYLLRYAYAYAFEYKQMFRHLFNTYSYGSEIEVTSIGCGSMLDYWALAHAVKYGTHIRYYGVDTIDWKYKVNKRDFDEVYFNQSDAIVYCEKYQKTSNVYIFPKSISEFSDNQVQQIADSFIPQYIHKDIVHFLISLRTDDNNQNSDIQKAEILYNRMLKIGYFCNNQFPFEPYNFLSTEYANSTIASIDSDFVHPGNIVDYLKVLYSQCIHFTDCQNSEFCKKTFCRYPMLNCYNANWLSMSFIRRNN